MNAVRISCIGVRTGEAARAPDAPVLESVPHLHRTAIDVRNGDNSHTPAPTSSSVTLVACASLRAAHTYRHYAACALYRFAVRVPKEPISRSFAPWKTLSETQDTNASCKLLSNARHNTYLPPALYRSTVQLDAWIALRPWCPAAALARATRMRLHRLRTRFHAC